MRIARCRSGGPRRAMVTLVVLSVVAAACGGGDSDDATSSTAGSTTTSEGTPMVSVSLPDYPFWANDVIREDPDLLDQLASEYAARVGGDLDVARFLYGEVPVVAFDRIFDGDADVEAAPGLLWLFHVSGYFGGAWLRDQIDRAQPDSALAGIHVPPTEEDFMATVATAGEGIDAAAADDSTVLDHVEGALFVPEGDDTGGLIDTFGYNQGYMLEILESPPEGLATPDEYAVTCAGPLRCEYATPKLAALEALAPTAQALADRADGYADLVDPIMATQEPAVERGRAVWSSGLSVQGFPQAEYDQLLDVSSSFLETVQATALAAVEATVGDDTDLARRAAIADAAMTVWLTAYVTGLTEGRGPAEPTFEMG